jgi:hypothetical protein
MEERNKQIRLEKRKRNQAYTAMNYFLSPVTCFDFFSKDTFEILNGAKLLAKNENQKVNMEFLLSSYFSKNRKVFHLLPDSEWKKNLLDQFQNIEPFLFQVENRKIVKNKFKDFFKLINKKNQNKLAKNPPFAYETAGIILKSTQNAVSRFKSPVITPEILLLTILENTSTESGKFMKKFFKNETEWYLFRYKLLKLVHSQESLIRNNVSKNQHYFAYLFRTQLSDKAFNNFIEKDELELGVAYFRNYLISDILKLNIFDFLLEEVIVSSKKRRHRKYSS